MNPLRLTASGLGRFELIDVEFPTGTVAIVGPNGAGKSTLLNAVELALFADGKRDLEPCLGPFADRLEIELTFDHDGTLYRARRGYRATGSGGKATLDLEVRLFAEPEQWEPLTRETAAATQALICETLGLSRATFNASAFLGQGNAGAFPDASPSERKQMLGEILDPHGLWPRLADHAKADTRAAEGERTMVDAQIADREPRVQNLAALQQQLVTLGTEEQLYRVAVTDAEEALEVASSELAGNAAAAERVKACTTKRDHARAAHAQALTALTAATQAQTDLPAARQRLLDLNAGASLVEHLEQRLDEQRRQAAEAQAHRERATRARQLITQLEETARARHREQALLMSQIESFDAYAQRLSGPGEEAKHCDRCQQVIGGQSLEAVLESLRVEAQKTWQASEAKAVEITEADEALAVARAEADEIKLPELAEVEDIATPLAQARAAAAGIPAAAHRVEQGADQAAKVDQSQAAHDLAEFALAYADAQLAAATHGVKDHGTLIRAVDAAKIELGRRRTTLEQAAADVVRTRQTVEQLQAAAAELVTLRAKLGEIHQRLDVLRLAERMFGRDGIPTLIAENIAVPQIEAGANEILEQLPTSDGVTFRVELRTQRALKSADHLKETLDIIVSDPDGQRAYETFSGGERARLNIALRIALARLLARRRGAESRLLAIDELEYLDELGQEKLVDVLRGLTGDFDRILVVSHAPGVRDAFDAAIAIEKSGGVSRIAAGERESVVA